MGGREDDVSARERLDAVNARLAGLFKADRTSMMAFRGLAEATTREGKVPSAMKEMIAVAIAATQGCDDCILYHVSQAKKHGADRETLVEVVAVAIEMAGGPGAVYAAKAIEAYDSL